MSLARVVGSIQRRASDSLLHLDVVNVGDSGFIHLKPSSENGYQISLKSIPQHHDFNCPYQLGYRSQDLPSHGDLYHSTLDQGDIIVLASDGVWDNLFPNEIISVINDQNSKPASQIAHAIATSAFKLAADSNRISPFAKYAQQHNIHSLSRGGKPDDIVVLVVKIQNLSRM